METDCTTTPAPLPRGTRLLHIGPHKTGTTSIQGALFAAKDRLPAHGVEFPGHTRHPMEAALAACARPAMMGDTVPTDRHWARLLRQVHATGRRTSVVSSQFFADAEGDDTITRKNGLRTGYEDWLGHMLKKAPCEEPTPSFWRRHRHDRLVERWARAVGPERVTVVVVDDRDRGGLMRAFEALLGLPENLLQPVPDTANRSLTLAETEMLRNLNREFRGNGLPDELYSTLVRNGAVMHMKNACSPTRQDVKISTPQWAVEAAAGIGAEMVDRIAHTGVRVLGDPVLLSAVPTSSGQGPREPRIAPEVAAQALYGALAAAAAVPGRPRRPGQGAHGSSDVFGGTREGARPPLPEEAAAALNPCAVTHSNSEGADGGGPTVTSSAR